MSVETRTKQLPKANLPDAEEQLKVAAAAARVANRLPELRLVLLGWRWPGKSLTGNTILGREDFHLERAAEFSVKRQTEVDGRQVTVVDTPGWFSSQTTPASYRQEMLRGPAMCPPGPHAFLLVIPVGMFTDGDRARVEEHVGLLGERVWHHILVVFTWAEVLRTISVERWIRREGHALQGLLQRCRNRYFVIDNCVFGQHPQLGRLMERVERLVAEEGGCYCPEEKKEPEERGEARRPLDKNQNQAQEARELGARPKQNSAPRLSMSLEVEPAGN